MTGEGEPRPAAGAEVLPIATLAELVAKHLPEADREEGARLLAREILPLELAGVAHHPRPRRLQEVVCEQLVAELAPQPPDRRLAILRNLLLLARLGDHGRNALALAIARYLHDHPEARPAAGAWLRPSVAAWVAAPPAEVAAEVARRTADLQALDERLRRESPDLHSTYALELLHADLDLRAAATGSFGQAAGSLADFLREVGAEGPLWPRF